MLRLSHRVAVIASFSVFAIAGARPAFAQETQDDGALPPLPKPAVEAAPPSNTVTVHSDTTVVQAQVVQTNRVDTVVVAQPGSTVTVHPGSHHEYAPDPGRKAAIIAAPIIFGVGAALAGITYLARGTSCTSTYDGQGNFHDDCRTDDGRVALWTYNIIVAAVPSTPRWVVGDVMGALLYTGGRTASVILASTIDWGHNDSSSWLGPFMLGFAVPITLGIVDLATTPHREDLARKDDGHDARAAGFRITAIAPTTLEDPSHKVNGGLLSLSATF